MTRHRTVGEERVRETSVPDTVRLGGTLLVPWPGRGRGHGRSRAVAWALRLGADRHAVRLMDRLRRRYGPGPLKVRLPGRGAVLLLSPRDVRHVLDARPGLFPPSVGDSAHPRPHGTALPVGAEDWADRRRVDEEVLDSHQKLHRFGGRYMLVAQEETSGLLDLIGSKGGLDWTDYASAHGRVVRHIVLGEAARDDQMLTALLDRLGVAASPLRPRGRLAVRDTYLRRLRMYIERADPGSLAGALARTPSPPGADPLGQVTQWLAGFDGAGVVAYRTLALLAVHPDGLARVHAELSGLPGSSPPSPVSVPYLRACVLESARLWPVAPVILREATADTHWGERTLPAGSVFAIVGSFFGRDRRTVPYADHFMPEAWLDGRAAADGAIVPFGGGAGRCPGENLALLTATTFLADLLRDHAPRLLRPATLHARRPLPYGLDPATIRFRFDPVR
ncbi:cytochrome P450 [Thermomonospora umbrina]|uniref:Cytochrome P450 n=1 Tax=Thermomonospora umbrina TaxID=111806 RepID=A0A3D9SW76_9ACTN|nr:cytochrome P450 [Thermomonospora umbrina]REF00200.1 cytochrome P450 [Thermomonospora umbrina]